MEITVFTATFNRADTLGVLYESLCKQMIKDFEWIIVDDGSIDETEEVISGFKEMGKISIRYIKQENQGKYIAINRGAKEARGNWFFMVDSDDHLTDDALEKVLFFCRQIEDDPRFAGVVGERVDSTGKIWDHWFGTVRKGKLKENRYIDANAIDYRYKYGIKGDKAEVVRTDILRRFPFPDGNHERFMVEGYLWLSLAKAGYQFRWFQEKIYVTEYLEDGLTRNINDHYLNSPQNSCMFFNLQLSCPGIPIKDKAKAAAKYFYYGRHGRIPYKVLIHDINACGYLVTGIVLSKFLVIHRVMNDKGNRI